MRPAHPVLAWTCSPCSAMSPPSCVIAEWHRGGGQLTGRIGNGAVVLPLWLTVTQAAEYGNVDRAEVP